MTRRVLIVGATSAIAQATARFFAAEHARLILVGRDPVKLQSVAEDLKVRGAEGVQCVGGDLTDDTLRAKILSQASEEWQGLDAALIAYGSLPDQAVCESEPAALQLALQTNYLSTAAWLSQIANMFESQNSGILAVIGSVAGDRGRRSNYVYGSAKAAIETFVAGLRQRLAPSAAHVILIKPGWVSTPMTAHLPQGFLYASPEQVGHGIYHAMLARRSVVFLPWYWKWIMFIIRRIPESILNKLAL